MTRIGPEIVFAVSFSLALCAAGGAPLAGQEASQAPVDREDLALVGAAIDALAGGDSEAAEDSLRQEARSGDGIARVVAHLLEAYRAYELYLPKAMLAGGRSKRFLEKATTRAREVPRADFSPVLAKIRSSFEDPGVARQSRLRALLCHLRLFSGEETAPKFEKPLVFGPGIEQPQRVFMLMPSMTDAARRARRSGTIISQVVIDQEGCVTHVKILKGMPYGLEQATGSALRWSAFEPAMADGEPVALFWNLTTNFSLK